VTVFLTLLTAFVGYLLYTRYVPVRGVKCIKKDELSSQPILVDLRDYSDSAKEVVVGAIALPIAYINRHHDGLPASGIVIIASDEVEKNIGIRLLKRHGHNVKGYAIINNPCKCKKYLAEFAS
jgi:hypothetical protein